MRPLPREITAALLDTLATPTELRARVLACRDEESLLAVDLPDDVFGRLLDAIYPKSVEAVVAEPSFVVSDIADLGRVADNEMTLTDFLLKLHPEQEKAVDWSTGGPLMIKGGPGTGKSMVLMYRARALLQQSDLYSRPPQVLFTTFTNSLTDRSARLLDRLVMGEGRDRITVVNVDKLVPAIARVSGKFDGAIEGDTRKLKALLAEVGGRAACVRPLNDDYLLDEFKWVIEGRGLASREDYMAADRAGRGVRLSAEQREGIWALYEAYTSEMSRCRLWTFERVRALALETVLAGKYRNRYDHVLIDEVQDLTPVAVRLLIGLASAPENVCLAMDANQSVYARGFRWRQVHEGLRFQGRTICLNRGYRTSREIALAARSVFVGESESDAETLDLEDSPPGDKPTLHAYRTETNHARAIANFLLSARLRCRVGWSGAAVLCLSNKGVAAMVRSLQAVGVPARASGGANGLPDGEEVAVLTVHNSKGLEFVVAVLADLDGFNFPRTYNLSQEECAEEDASARRLFFVGATRAMCELLVTFPAARPSPLVTCLDAAYWRRSAE